MSSFFDAYKGRKKRREAAERVLRDSLENREFCKKAYMQLDFNEAVAILLSDLLQAKK